MENGSLLDPRFVTENRSRLYCSGGNPGRTAAEALLLSGVIGGEPDLAAGDGA